MAAEVCFTLAGGRRICVPTAYEPRWPPKPPDGDGDGDPRIKDIAILGSIFELSEAFASEALKAKLQETLRAFAAEEAKSLPQGVEVELRAHAPKGRHVAAAHR